MHKHYYVNKKAQSNGDHEVHTEECDFLPGVLNREYLDYYIYSDYLKCFLIMFPVKFNLNFFLTIFGKTLSYMIRTYHIWQLFQYIVYFNRTKNVDIFWDVFYTG